MRVVLRLTVVLAVLMPTTAAVSLRAVQAVAAPPAVDIHRSWNNLALDTIRVKRASDAQAARLYAMVNVAIYDAVNGILSRHGSNDREHALVPTNGAPAQGDIVAAAAAAAHAVLVGLYPDQSARFDAQLESDFGGLGHGGRVTSGRAWGEHVGAEVLAARSNDGSSPEETQPAGSGPGQFRASWSGTQFRNLAPFAISDPSLYVSPGPPALTSLDYAAAFAEVKLLGNAAIPDADKLTTFQYWSLGTGTSQPPGAWIQIALAVSSARSLELPEAARLFALISMAMCDTVAPTFQTKFVHRFWRPATAIREADTDDNPNTTADPSWAPRAGGIGTSPEHWSGHSSFSGAAATVLAGFFCQDNISFSLVTDSAPNGQSRTYASFSAAEAEAGQSRVVGGIHFNFSNQAGLAAGRGVGAEVLSRSLLLKRGQTHFGQCPL
jgi:PAP2 superfamily protein